MGLLIKTFTRNLLLATNDYHAATGEPTDIRHVYVSQDFYEQLCAYFGSRGDAYQGYKIMVVVNDDHPDYLIYLRWYCGQKTRQF